MAMEKTQRKQSLNCLSNTPKLAQDHTRTNGEHERVDIHRRADGKASTPKIKPCKDHQNK